MASMNAGQKRSTPRTRISPGTPNPATLPAGVVGLGLMGTSITSCLLSAGHPVAAVEVNPARRRTAKSRILVLLREMKEEGLIKSDPESLVARLSVFAGCAGLSASQIVVEAITESVEAKKQIIREIEEVVSPKTLIGSNTSAIPVSILQEGAAHPQRILGMHWAEPAHIARFMEIICGKDTQPACAERAVALARGWGKEPSLVRRDIRGFIANRCFYALLREAFHLVEQGYATPADVDRSLRNDLGYWITFAGPFRFMDLTGVPAYAAVMEDLFPDLNCETEVPSSIKKLVASGAQGISNARGFYKYTPREAKLWEKKFLEFSYEIRALALKYGEGTAPQSRRQKRSGRPAR